MTTAKRYSDARTSLKTGDVVLFSGKGGISAGIKWATFSRWSHVGMVLVLPEYDFVCLWESTTLSSIADLDSGVARKGVQLVPLSIRVQQYDGEIAVRSLGELTLSNADVTSLMALRKALARKPYERDKLELIKSAFDLPLGANSEDLSSLFCSELVAEAYQELGLLPSGERAKPSNEYTPADFSADDEDLPWVKGRLGPEVMLTR